MADITQCPSCQRKLQVPETLMGYDVQCPTCGAAFTAKMPGAGGGFSQQPMSRDLEPDPRRPNEHYPAESRGPYDSYGGAPFRPNIQPHRGGLILTFGVLSLVTCMLFGIAAIAMGNADLAAMRAGRMDPEGEGLTQAGRICGIISVVFTLVGCGCYFLIFAAMAPKF